MRQISGTHFLKSFSDGVFRAFRGPRAAQITPAERVDESVRSGAPSHTPISALSSARPWLNAFPWEKVLATNQAQCQLQNTQTTPNPKAYDAVKSQWEQRVPQNISLEKALDFCRECEQRAPFVFSNTSTFSQVGKGLIEDIAKNLPSVEAHIIRNTVAHYVSGTVAKKELFDILRFYETQWRPGLDKASGNGVGHRPPSDA